MSKNIISRIAAILAFILAFQPVLAPAAMAQTKKGGSLGVTSVFPEGGSIENPPGTKILVTFDRDLEEKSVHLFSVILEDTGEGKRIFGALKYNSQVRSISFIPSRPLEEEHQYRLTITPGVKGSEGESLKKPVITEFGVAGNGSAQTKYIRRAVAPPLTGPRDQIEIRRPFKDSPEPDSKEIEAKVSKEWLDTLDGKLDSLRINPVPARAGSSVKPKEIAAAPEMKPKNETFPAKVESPVIEVPERTAAKADSPRPTRRKRPPRTRPVPAEPSEKIATPPATEETSTAERSAPVSGRARKISVLGFKPPRNSVKVSKNPEITVEFDRALWSGTDLSSILRLQVLKDGEEVAISNRIGTDGKSLVATVEKELLGDTLYLSTLSGLTRAEDGTTLGDSLKWFFRTSGARAADESPSVSTPPATPQIAEADSPAPRSTGREKVLERRGMLALKKAREAKLKALLESRESAVAKLEKIESGEKPPAKAASTHAGTSDRVEAMLDSIILGKGTGRLGVVSTTPADGSDGARPDADIVVKFSESLAGFDNLSGYAGIYDASGNRIPSEIKGSGKSMLVFPDSPLNPGESYELRLSAALSSEAGSTLGTDRKYRFTVHGPARTETPIARVEKMTGSKSSAGVFEPVKVAKVSEPDMAGAEKGASVAVASIGSGKADGETEGAAKAGKVEPVKVQAESLDEAAAAALASVSLSQDSSGTATADASRAAKEAVSETGSAAEPVPPAISSAQPDETKVEAIGRTAEIALLRPGKTGAPSGEATMVPKKEEPTRAASSIPQSVPSIPRITSEKAVAAKAPVKSKFDTSTLLERLRTRLDAIKKVTASVAGNAAEETGQPAITAVTTGPSPVMTGASKVDADTVRTTRFLEVTGARPSGKGGLEVVSHAPDRGASDVGSMDPVIVTLGSDLDPKTVNTSTVRILLMPSSIPVKARVFAVGNKIFASPARPGLNLGESYICALSSAISSRAGVSLGSDYVWDFATVQPPDGSVTVRRDSSDKGLAADGLKREFEKSRGEAKPPAEEKGIPSIAFTVPSDGAADVLPGIRMQVGFSTDMDSGSISMLTARVQERGSDARIPVNVYYEKASKVVFLTPVEPLAKGREFTVTVSKDVRSAAGTKLGSDKAFSFTTAGDKDSTPPRVVQREPVSGAEGVDIRGNVIVKFDEPVDPASASLFSVTVNDGTKNVMGSVIHSDKHGTVTFIPRGTFDFDTIYKVTVSGIRDIAGNSMPEPDQWLFRTVRRPDSEAPRVVSVKPLEGEEDVSPYVSLSVVLSEPIDPVTVTHNSIGLWDGTRYIEGKVVYDEKAMTLSFFSSARLQERTLYNAYVSRGIRDMSGNAMGEHFVWTFVTSMPPDNSRPQVVDIHPTIGSRSVAVASEARVTFSEGVNPSSLNWSTMGIKDESTGAEIPVEISYDPERLTARMIPTHRLSYATVYRAWVGTGVKDPAGNLLAAGADWAFTTENRPDTDPPRVVSVSPVVGARNVPINTDVSVIFSEPLLDESVTPYSLTLSGPGGAMITGDVIFDPITNMMVLTPKEALSHDAVYTVTVSNSLEDLAGNRMPRQFAYGFKTVGEDFARRLREDGVIIGTPGLAVEASDPVDGARDVKPGSDIVLTFNRSVASETVNEDSIFVLDEMGRGLRAAMSYDNVKKQVLIRPLDPMNPRTAYTVVVAGGTIHDTLGHPLLNDFVLTFGTAARDGSSASDSTRADRVLAALTGSATADADPAKMPAIRSDAEPPLVVTTSPANGSTDVTETPSITVEFNEDMDPVTLTAHTFTLDDGDTYVPGSVSYHGPTRKALFSPKVPLRKGATYRVTISREVRDLAGNTLVSPKVFTFTVRALRGPSVVKIHPSNGAEGVSITSDVRVSFDKQIMALTLTGFNFVVRRGDRPVEGRISYDTFTRQAIFIPDKPLEYGSDYQVRLLPGVQDVSGSDMEEYAWSFKTVGKPF